MEITVHGRGSPVAVLGPCRRVQWGPRRRRAWRLGPGPSWMLVKAALAGGLDLPASPARHTSSSTERTPVSPPWPLRSARSGPVASRVPDGRHGGGDQVPRRTPGSASTPDSPASGRICCGPPKPLTRIATAAGKHKPGAENRDRQGPRPPGPSQWGPATEDPGRGPPGGIYIGWMPRPSSHAAVAAYKSLSQANP